MLELPKIEFLEAQAEFLADTTTEFIGLMGSYRSGKTKVACYKAIQLAAMHAPYNGAMYEPTMGQVQTLLIPEMTEALESIGFVENESFYVYRSSSDPKIEIKFPHGKAKIYLKASENVKRIVGFSCAWFIADEFDTSGYAKCNESWQKMVARLTKGKAKKQAIITSTKEGFQWAYKFFVEDAESLKKEHEEIQAKKPVELRLPFVPDRRMIDIFVKDNYFIDDDFVERNRRNMSPKQFEAFIENKFVNFATGSVYYTFDRTNSRTKFSLADQDKKQAPLFVGVDFNVGKMAAVVALIDEDRCYVVDEIYGCQNTVALADEILRRYPRRPIHLYVDGAGNAEKSNSSESDITILRGKFGGSQSVSFRPKHLPIADRVNSVNARFLAADGQTRKLWVNDTLCPILTKCLEAQGYDASGKPDKANDLDHLPDALGYLVSYIWPLISRSGNITRLTG